MKFIKDKKEKRRNYLLQKDKITKSLAVFVSLVLILLVIAVASTYSALS